MTLLDSELRRAVPVVQFSLLSAGTHFVFQWQHESEVENRFRGDALWFKLIAAL